MRNISIYLLIILIGALVSCEENPNQSLPGYSGRQGEIVIIIDNHLWNGQEGKMIKGLLEAPQYGLPQNEPLFHVITAEHKNFSTIFRTYRNLIIVDIDPEKKTAIDIRKSVWAKDQLVVELTASNATEFSSLFLEYIETIVNRIAEAEIERLISRHKKLGEKSLNTSLTKQLGLTIAAQKDAYIATKNDCVVWIRVERERPVGGYQHQISQGVLIYSYPYKNKEQLQLESLLAVKDSIGKIYLPGPNEGAYMITSKKLLKPIAKEITFNKKYAVEIRGLWRMQNGFMGGPFISLSFVDEKKNRIVTAEGYVYAPQFNKREYLREVEAMVKSIRFSSSKN